MTRYKVVSTRKLRRNNSNESIKGICYEVTLLGGRRHISTKEAIQMIEEEGVGFYVANPKKVDVVVAISELGNKFLTTKPDGLKLNNLSELPECSKDC
jgi:hypothetical protein